MQGEENSRVSFSDVPRKVSCKVIYTLEIATNEKNLPDESYTRYAVYASQMKHGFPFLTRLSLRLSFISRSIMLTEV